MDRPNCDPEICRNRPQLHMNHIVESIIKDVHNTIKFYRMKWEESKEKDRKTLLVSFSQYVDAKREWEVDGPMFTDGSCLDADVIEKQKKAKEAMLETETLFKSQ